MLRRSRSRRKRPRFPTPDSARLRTILRRSLAPASAGPRLPPCSPSTTGPSAKPSAGQAAEAGLCRAASHAPCPEGSTGTISGRKQTGAGLLVVRHDLVLGWVQGSGSPHGPCPGGYRDRAGPGSRPLREWRIARLQHLYPASGHLSPQTGKGQCQCRARRLRVLDSIQAAIEARLPPPGRNAGSRFPRLRGKREGKIEAPRQGDAPALGQANTGIGRVQALARSGSGRFSESEFPDLANY
jgi:hypothetical protein